VAGARIAASGDLRVDSIAIGVPTPLGSEALRDDDLRIATSDAAGQFAIDDAVPEGVIAAQLADRRSGPAAIADRVRLVLEPTRSVSGKVELAGRPYTRVVISCAPIGDPTGRLDQNTTVAPDGSFAISGVSTGARRLGAAERSNSGTNEHIEFMTVPASRAPVTGLVLGFSTSNRTIDVIVRSAVATPLEGGQVILLSGRQQI